MLHIIYRSVAGDNRKGRPPFFSKLLCLQSLLNSALRLNDGVNVTFVNDGPIPADRLSLMERFGRIVTLGGIGNSPSYRAALAMAVELPNNDLVYLAEDDYLYRDNAFEKLVTAFDQLPQADYITLFDHLDRYRRRDDARRGYSRLYLADGHHWRSVESTCMTFGARVRTLRSDAWIHRLATVPRTPRDRYLWRGTLGQKQFFLKLPKRLLIGPVPSLATHMDPDSLAPNVDWEAIAAKVRSHYL